MIKKHKTTIHASQRQHGIALFIVIVFVMLSMLLALWASRTSIFNEMVVGNDADYQRAFEAAQAMLQDAELDIRNENADGTVCTTCRKTMIYADAKTNPKKFPTTVSERETLLAELDNESTQCKNGLCMRRTNRTVSGTTIEPWTAADLNDLAAKGIGARYGEYTKAERGEHTNPLLNWVNYADPIKVQETTNAWYWIEILPYVDDTGGGVEILGEGSNKNLWLPVLGQERVAYRVTAMARGLKPNTQVILQQVYIRRYHSGDGDDI